MELRLVRVRRCITTQHHTQRKERNMSGAYEVVRKEAESLSVIELKPRRGDLSVARHNLRLGIAAVARFEDELKGVFKKYTPVGERIEQLLAALDETDREMALARPMRGLTRKTTAPVYADRRLLMLQLEAWGKTGLVPEQEVAAIVAGRGAIDAAEDVIAILALTARYPACKAKLLISPSEAQSMLARAEAMLEVITPTRQQERANEALEAATDRHTRVWTLLLRQHSVLWQHGALIYEQRVDDFVVPIGRRGRAMKKKIAEPVPA